MKIKNYMKKNIALIGHMGSGKSVIGSLIAKKLEYKHIDSDNIIEKLTKKTINDLFQIYGEDGFREIEKKTILNLQKEKKMILSLGGGSILTKEVRDFLKNNFITIFLDIDVETLVDRLKNSHKRPLLLNENIENKIKKLDKDRRKFYLAADIIIGKYENPSQTLSTFLDEYKKINAKNT